MRRVTLRLIPFVFVLYIFNFLDRSNVGLAALQMNRDLKFSAGAFSVLPADVLLNAFQTSPGDPLVSGYTHHTVDVTAILNSHLGTPLTLRFAEADNVFTLQLGVDNVDIDVNAGAVPEPSSWLLAFGALSAIGLGRRFLAR